MQDAIDMRNKLLHYVETGEYPIKKSICKKCGFLSLLELEVTKCEFCGNEPMKMEVEE